MLILQPASRAADPTEAAPVPAKPAPTTGQAPAVAAPAKPKTPSVATPPKAAQAPAAAAPETPAPAADEIPTDKPVARAEPVMERDVTTRLQIFLDQQLFGPGKIDGRPGEFFKKALIRYQRAHGLPETGQMSPEIPLDSVYPVYSFYTIKEGDLKFVGDTPSKPAEQAKKKYLPYTSLLEFLTERYHCAPEFLEKLNPTMKLGSLKPGDAVRVPNVEPFVIEELPKQGFLPEVEERKQRVITINRAEKMLDLHEGDKLLASVPITPGGGKLETPAGTGRSWIRTMPTFRWDSRRAESRRTDRGVLQPAGRTK